MTAWVECDGCFVEAIWSSDSATVDCPTCGRQIRLRPSRADEYRRASGTGPSDTELKESA